MPVVFPWRRAGVVLAVCLLCVLAMRLEALAQATPIQISVGETTTFELDGNPSTGYSWVLADAHSSSVTVDMLGYAKPQLKPGERSLLGAPQKFQVLVTGVEAGNSHLVFHYVKAGEATPARTAAFDIEVLGSAPERDALNDEGRDLFSDPAETQDGGGSPDPF